MKKVHRRIAGLLLAIAAPSLASAQDVALKTDLVNDALLSPNIGVEVGLAPR